MAATHDIINGTDADIATYGGSAVTATKRVINTAVTMTDAQAIAGAQVDNVAVMKASSTAASKAQVAGVLLDDILASVDLSTPAKRKTFRLKKGLAELYDILARIGA